MREAAMRLSHLMRKGHEPIWLHLIEGGRRMCETCDLKPPSRGQFTVVLSRAPVQDW